MEFPTNSYQQLEPYYTVIVTNSVTKENHVKLGLIDAMSCPKHNKNNKRKESWKSNFAKSALSILYEN